MTAPDEMAAINQASGREGEVTLAECPVGLFWSGEYLCLKTEYGNNEGRIDAYIVASGEFFWGTSPQTIANQRQQRVVPIDCDEAHRALAKPDEGAVERVIALNCEEIGILKGRQVTATFKTSKDAFDFFNELERRAALASNNAVKGHARAS